MRAADRTAYIVACIRKGAGVYPEDAEQILAEHDAEVRAEALNSAATELIAFCPDHGDKGTAFIACQCLGAEDLQRMAKQGGDRC